MMRAAIYARKSTESNVSLEAKSVVLQEDAARAFVAVQGWTVAEGHIYTDDAISGGTFNRPGLSALLRAVRTSPCPFEVLVLMDASRLGREMTDTAVLQRDIIRAGVRIFYTQSGQELVLVTPTDKLRASIENFSAEDYRHQIKVKTRTALFGRAARGQTSLGGLCYGYRSLRDGARAYRAIDEAQAAIVRRIFALAAEGHGLVRIAKTLTREGIPKPPGRGRGWAPSAIREMLYRPIYAGQFVYGKTRWADRKGGKVKVAVPAREWITRDVPELRIVPADLWAAARASLAHKRDRYLRATQGRLLGRPEGSRESPYLLSGISQCGRCGGSMFSVERTRRGWKGRYYGCFHHKSRGPGGCTNSLMVPMGEADRLVLSELERDVLAPDVVEQVLAETLRALRDGIEPAQRQRAALEQRLRQLDTEITRLTDALAGGAPLASVEQALAVREGERRDGQAALEHLDGLGRATERIEDGVVRADLRRRLGEWSGLLHRQPAQARQILKKLLDGRLVFPSRTSPAAAMWGTSSERRRPMAACSPVSFRWCPRGGWKAFGTRKSAVLCIVEPRRRMAVTTARTG
jgi:site-specific DNA recombinase